MINYVKDHEIGDIINNNDDLIMVFGKGTNCSVCHAVEDRVNKILSPKYPKLKIYYLEVDESPTFRGQHLIFTVPTILLFENNKEIHRESRIIDFTRLERILKLYFE